MTSVLAKYDASATALTVATHDLRLIKNVAKRAAADKPQQTAPAAKKTTNRSSSKSKTTRC